MKYFKFYYPSTSNRLSKLRANQSISMHNLAIQCLEELYNNDYYDGKPWKDIIEKHLIIAANINAGVHKS